MESLISVKNLNKEYKVYEKPEGIKNTIVSLYKRKYFYKQAVSNVSFTINKGEIVGLLGENGAGKTTTLKILSGILYPSSGEVEVIGYKPTDRKKKFLKNIAFVTGNKNEVNWDLPAIDTFRYQQLVYDISDTQFEKNLSLLTEILDVSHLLNTQLRRLSLGERMKMEIINNLIYSPEIIFFDEPTIGLDLNSQISIRKFIKEYRNEKKATIIITSHYMDDIEETCDRIIILKKGQKTFDGHIDSLKSSKMSFKNIVREMITDEITLKINI